MTDCAHGVSQKCSWEQLVTYLGHSKEHCKTSLAEYWGVGGARYVKLPLGLIGRGGDAAAESAG